MQAFRNNSCFPSAKIGIIPSKYGVEGGIIPSNYIAKRGFIPFGCFEWAIIRIAITMARQRRMWRNFFSTTVYLPCNSILPHGCACFICSCRLRREKYYRLNSNNTRISPRPNVCVTAQNYCLTTLLQPLLCYLAYYKEMYFQWLFVYLQ